MKKPEVYAKLVECLKETGHWVSGAEDLPKRGGYHYTSLEYTAEACIDLALKDFFAKEPYEHWYADGKSIFLLIGDKPEDRTVKPKDNFSYDDLAHLLPSLKDRYGKDGLLPPGTFRAGNISDEYRLDAEDESNRRKFRYARNKDSIDRLIELRKGIPKEKEATQE